MNEIVVFSLNALLIITCWAFIAILIMLIVKGFIELFL